jgi:hypothetical protein
MWCGCGLATERASDHHQRGKQEAKAPEVVTPSAIRKGKRSVALATVERVGVKGIGV